MNDIRDFMNYKESDSDEEDGQKVKDDQVKKNLKTIDIPEF